MNDSRLTMISTAAAVVDALGGGTEAANMVGCTPQNICNAVRRGRLPPSAFLIFTDELARRGFRARPQLWGIKPLKRRPSGTRAHMAVDYAQQSEVAQGDQPNIPTGKARAT
jgi:hypothetical protein